MGRLRLAMIGVVLGATIGVVGVATAIDNPPGPRASTANDDNGDPETYGIKIRQPGRGLPRDEAIRTVVQAMRSVGIDSAAVTEPTQDDPGQAPGLELTLAADQRDDVAGNSLLLYKGAVAAGAILELMHSDEAAAGSVIGNFDVVADRPNGDQATYDGGIGYVSTGMRFADQIENLSDAQIEGQARDTLAKFGLTVESVQVYRPLGPALEIHCSISDDTKIDWDMQALVSAVQGEPDALEGVFIQIDSPDGQPRALSFDSMRTGLGSEWAPTPELGQRFGVTSLATH